MTNFIIAEKGPFDDNNKYRNECADEGAFDAWKRQYLSMKRHGVYRQIAPHIPVTSNDTMLDIGAGFCPFEVELKRLGVTPTCIAIEVNDVSANHARRHLASKGVPAYFFRGRIKDIVYLDEDQPSNGQLTQKNINDIRNHTLILPETTSKAEETLDELLEAKKVDISLLSFVGASAKQAIIDARRNIDLYPGLSPGHAQSNEAFIDAITLATKLTRTGGRLLRAERFHLRPNTSPDSAARQMRKLYSDLFAPFWQIINEGTYFLPDQYELAHVNADLPSQQTFVQSVGFERTETHFVRQYFDDIRGKAHLMF